MLHICLYEPKYRELWNEFVGKSKNGLFLFHRDYLEYHADRFSDFSLMIYEGERLVAIMPANRVSGVLYSHSGLTFGGVISDSKMNAVKMVCVFELLMSFIKQHGINSLIYKAIPYIFHVLPAQEDLYAISLNKGRLIRRDLSSAIKMNSRLPLSKGKKSGLRKARQAGIQVSLTSDFPTYMPLLEEVVRQHGATPTHTLSEIVFLAERFPKNIKLFAAHKDRVMVAGIITYEYGSVAHTQYMASNALGKEFGALDLIVNYLLEEYYSDFNYFSFGISTEQQGRYLNHGLVSQKEMFGARSVVHDFYELTVS